MKFDHEYGGVHYWLSSRDSGQGWIGEANVRVLLYGEYGSQIVPTPVVFGSAAEARHHAGEQLKLLCDSGALRAAIPIAYNSK